MNYMVYTFGGGDILVQVFNAIGRVFASNSEYLTPVGKFAMTAGAIWAGSKALLKGDLVGFSFGWLMPSFLAFTLLFAPKASVWVKDEVSMSAPVKIDNIPIGIALFSSLSSKISFALSQMLEKHLLPVDVDAGLSVKNTGIMFGAKAAGKIRDVQIRNPTTLRNTKEYMRQCFMKPYIIGDLLGKKGLAQSSDDIIGFIEANPPMNFGIYYRDPVTNVNSFKTCKQATPLIKAALSKDIGDGLLTSFAIAIGIQSDQTAMLKPRLKAMTEDTLRYLKKDQSDIHDWMKQAMLLNANRESYDDWREKHSLNRIYPELVAMNATRGMFQQSFGWLTAGEMAANMMPILQSTFFSIIICLIFIVFPMAMLPAGTGVLKTWIMLMIWVNSWPVFFTIIHCLGMMALAGKSAGLGNGGLSILSQGSFSEITLNTYATYQMFAASVPVLAWAVLKGCAHATTALAGNFSGSQVASSLGSGSADNIVNIDNITQGSRSINQRQLAPTTQIGGGSIDDGGMRVVTTGDGDQIVTEPIDSLQTNYRASQSYSDSLQSQLTESQTKMGTLTNRSSELASAENRQLTDLAHRIADGTATIEGMSTSEQEALRETLSKGVTSNSGTSSRDTKDTTTNSSFDAEASLGGGLPLIGGLSIKGKTGTSASNTKGLTKEQSVSEQKTYSDALEKVKTAAKNNSVNSTSDEVKSLTKGLSQTWSEQSSVGQELAQTSQTMRALQSQKTYVDQNSATIDRNVNDDVLQRVVQTHPELGSKAKAAKWMREHRDETDQIAREVMQVHNPIPTQAGDLQNVSSDINNHQMKTKDDLKNQATQDAKKVEEQATSKNDTGKTISLPEKVNNNIETAKTGYNKKIGQTLNNMMSDSEKSKAENLGTINNAVDEAQKHLDGKFKKTTNSTVLRINDEVASNILTGVEGLGENVGDIVDPIIGNPVNKKRR